MNVAYGMVRGLGKQAIATQISLVAVMISYAIAHFSFFHFDLGIVGLQSSIAVCTILMAIGFTSMVFCINWPNLFQEVRERKEKVTGVKNAGNNLEWIRFELNNWSNPTELNKLKFSMSKT